MLGKREPDFKKESPLVCLECIARLKERGERRAESSEGGHHCKRKAPWAIPGEYPYVNAAEEYSLHSKQTYGTEKVITVQRA